jgi:hypothetical protein
MREVIERGPRCKHRRFWVLGDRVMWCYECGALRAGTPSVDGIVPLTGWQKPVGPGGENPGSLPPLRHGGVRKAVRVTPERVPTRARPLRAREPVPGQRGRWYR